MASFESLCLGYSSCVNFTHFLDLSKNANNVAGPFGTERVHDDITYELSGNFVTDNLNGKSAVSVAFLVYPSTLTGSDRIFSFDINTSSVGYHVARSSDDLYIQCRSISSDSTKFDTHSTVFTANEWHLVCVTLDYANDLIISYIDGTTLTDNYRSTVTTFSSTTGSLGSPSKVYIGHDAGGSKFEGSIAAFAVFDGVLSQANMQNLATGDATAEGPTASAPGSSFEDEASTIGDVYFSLPDTLGDSADWQEESPFTGEKAFYLPRYYSDPAGIDTLNGVTGISIAGWFKVDNVTGNKCIIRMQFSAPTAAFVVRVDSNDLLIGARSQSGDSFQSTTVNNVITADQWHFLGFVADFTNDQLIYRIDSTTGTPSKTFGSSTAVFSSMHSFTFGMDEDFTSELFAGSFFMMTLWNKALTATNLTTLYNAPNGRAAASGSGGGLITHPGMNGGVNG